MGSKGRSRGDSLGHGAFYTPDENGEGAAPETLAPEQTFAEQLEELPHDELVRIVETMEEDMRNASAAMDFEEAARLRDAVVQIRAMLEGASEDETLERLRSQARKGSTFASGRKRQRFKHEQAPSCSGPVVFACWKTRPSAQRMPSVTTFRRRVEPRGRYRIAGLDRRELAHRGSTKVSRIRRWICGIFCSRRIELAVLRRKSPTSAAQTKLDITLGVEDALCFRKRSSMAHDTDASGEMPGRRAR